MNGASYKLDVPAYLARIGCHGPFEPTLESLRLIHRAHLLAVPFENLDIHLKREIVVDEDAFVCKIVQRRRGGFCYEMNGAFAALLRGLGFRITLLSARVPREDGSEGPEFDHLALRVDLDEPWLADVGFGDSFLEPLRLRSDGAEQPQDGRNFRIVEVGEWRLVERMEPDGLWKKQFLFTLQPRQLQDFTPMCRFHQTSPESPFTRRRVCTMATSDGRITLADRKLIVTANGKKEERELASEEEWRSVLNQMFGVVL